MRATFAFLRQFQERAYGLEWRQFRKFCDNLQELTT